MNDKEKKYSDEEVEKIVKDFFDNMILVLSFLPQNFYEEILGEVKHRRALVNSIERIMIPAEERRDFRAYSISKIIKREVNDER